MGILFTAIFAGIEVIWDKQFGFLKETLVAPVSRLQIMVGRTLGGATVATMQGLIVLFITFFVGFRPTDWWMILPAILFMILIALFFTALGTAIASRLDDMQGFQVIMNFLVMPIFFLSGALFPLTGLPPVIEFLVKIDPLSYGVDAIRGALVGGSQFGFGLDITVLLVITAIMLVLGAWLFSGIEA
jgi:ABC-2 type transport system permease protein